MSAAVLIRQAFSAGVKLRIDDCGSLKAAGPSDTLREWSPRLRAHKSELLEFLQDAHASTAQLVEAAMRCCDHFGDSPGAREELEVGQLVPPIVPSTRARGKGQVAQVAPAVSVPSTRARGKGAVVTDDRTSA